MRTFVYLSFIIAVAACSTNQKPQTVEIGNYYPDVLHGITFKLENNQAFLFRIGFLDTTGNYTKMYSEHRDMFEDESGQKFGPSAPDYSYNKYGFTTDDRNVIWIEWSKTDNAVGAVGKIYSEKPSTIYIEAMQAFPKAPGVFYHVEGDRIRGWLSKGDNYRVPDWQLKIINKFPEETFAANIDLHKKIEKADTLKPDGMSAAVASKYRISQEEPLYFIAGLEESNHTMQRIESRLQEKYQEYDDTRFKLHTPFGEIWEAVSNHLNKSRVYGSQTKLTGHVVSRGWCNGHNQRLFEWDTFFHALLASLEDPEGARESVRAILAHQTPIGIVPNNTYGNDTVNNSNDRSQPPVGSICVWKMHQYQPDIDFLREVYPKLLKWHNWWFDIRPEDGLPYRDGNQNGLLEWGTEIDNWLQGAKYESGLDNSPMFDDARLNINSGTMELDMAGLSGLWAADALYLSYIAEELGDTEEAERLKAQVKEMNNRINSELWNEELGMYCNKYWNEYSRKPKDHFFTSIPASYFTEDITFSYTSTTGDSIVNKVKYIGLTREEAAFYSENAIPVYWNAQIIPDKSATCFFHTPEEMGVVLEVNGKKLIDNRQYWITEYVSEPVHLHKDSVYLVKLTYTGDIPFELKITPEIKTEGSLFSERLSPTLFYPLIAGAADEKKGQQIISNLTDTTLFWGDYVIPTIAKNDPAYPTQGYWRGRVWPPTNYLAYLGIDNYAGDSIVWQLVEKSARMAQTEWMKQGHLHENYNAITGVGTGTSHYCWGGLMQLMLLEELANFNKDGTKTSNPHANDSCRILNFPLD